MKTMLALLTTAALGGCAAPSPRHVDAKPADGECFNVSFVQGYSSVDRDTIRLDVGPGTSYDVDISGGRCDQVDWTQKLALESTPSSWICVGKQVGQGNIHFRDPTTRRRTSCYIEDVRRVATAR